MAWRPRAGQLRWRFWLLVISSLYPRGLILVFTNAHCYRLLLLFLLLRSHHRLASLNLCLSPGHVWLVTSSLSRRSILHEVKKCVWYVDLIFQAVSIWCLSFSFFKQLYIWPGEGFWRWSVWSARHVGQRSPPCSCFPSPLVLRFLSVVRGVQRS